MVNESEGAIARDEALDSVLRHDWIWRSRIIAFIENLPHGWVGTGEDIRHMAQKCEIINPGHPNAWGAAIMYAVKKKLLHKTGKMHQPKDKASHARGIWEYVRLDEEKKKRI